MQNSTATKLYNLLITHDFDPEALDGATGKEPVNDQGMIDISQADMFSFDWTNQGRNYGTVVILLGPERSLEVYFGNSLGRGMESEDKNAWYRFLEQLKSFSTANRLPDFKVENLNRLKYTMRGIAAIKEGLFEGYYGTRRVSYTGRPRNTRLMIRHNRDLDEGDARYRNIESIYIETDQGERFRLPFTKLVGARAMERHVREGGNPYDTFGQHITQMVEEMNVLSRFVRAARSRDFDSEAAGLVEAGIRHYGALKNKVKKMISQRGYHEEKQTWRPDDFTDSEVTVEAIRDMFIEQNLDSRIEEALPLLAKLGKEEHDMKEADEFESWANRLAEGTWAIPDTPEEIKILKDFMSKEQPVGPDATNATEILYDVLGDDNLFDRLGALADNDPEADARDVVKDWILDHQFDPNWQDVLRPVVVELNLDDQEQNVDIDLGDQDNEVQEATRVVKGPHGDLEITDTPTGQTVKRISGWEKMNPGSAWDEPDDLPWHGSTPRAAGNRQVYRDVSFDENLDTDGVMMTRPSNMSSESKVVSSELARLLELAKK